MDNAASGLYIEPDLLGRFRKTGTVVFGITANAAVESAPPLNANPGILSQLLYLFIMESLDEETTLYFVIIEFTLSKK